MSIRTVLAGLRPQDRDKLNYAFENGLTNQFVVFAPGRFIGVNMLDTLRSVRIEQTEGHWSIGTLTNGEG
jgi:hypothetical protein